MRLPFLCLLLTLALAASACGGGSGAKSTPFVSARETVTVHLSAGNRLFDLEMITVQANTRVRIELTNLDADPHNFAVYDSPAAEQQFFVSDTISGRGATTSGTFDAPPTGTYFFRCDVHPVTMTGEFVVE